MADEKWILLETEGLNGVTVANRLIPQGLVEYDDSDSDPEEATEETGGVTGDDAVPSSSTGRLNSALNGGNAEDDLLQWVGAKFIGGLEFQR